MIDIIIRSGLNTLLCKQSLNYSQLLFTGKVLLQFNLKSNLRENFIIVLYIRDCDKI